MLFRNLVFSAVLVGILSGIVLGLVQQLSVVPTILAAEVYEIADEEPVAAGHEHAAHSHDPEAWGPEDGAERIFFPFVSNLLAGIGFSMGLFSAMEFSGMANVKNGILWGLAGYITFFVAPGFGLHPEIPGMEAANLQGRQGWWITTVVFTGLGLALIAFAPMGAKIAGLVLLSIPHILGAPLPEVHGFLHPDAEAVSALEGLAHSFVQSTAIANAVFWIVVGVASGFCINKFSLEKPLIEENS